MSNVGLEFWIWEVLSGIWNVEIVWHGNCSVENGFCNWSCFGFLAPVSVLEFVFLLLLWELDNQVPLAGGPEMRRLTVFWSWSGYRPRWSRHWHLMSMSNHNLYHLQIHLLQHLLPGAPPSSHDPPGASAMPPPNVPLPSTPAPATSPSTSYLRICTICRERSVLAKWVLHEPSLHCNQAFNKLHFNALQFMF